MIDNDSRVTMVLNNNHYVIISLTMYQFTWSEGRSDCTFFIIYVDIKMFGL